MNVQNWRFWTARNKKDQILSVPVALIKWKINKTQKSYFFSPFQKKLTSNENLPLEDDVTEKIWWQNFLTPTQDLEYLTGFSTFIWEHARPVPNFQVAKIAIFGHFEVFF